jgi:DNA-binding LytR/AlgR family response regulator
MENFILKNEKEIRIISVKSLSAIKVDDYICTFYVENEEKFSCTKSLRDIGDQLPDHFIRISRNTIINCKKIKSMNLKKREILMVSGDSFIYPSGNFKHIKERMRIHCNGF